MMINEFAILVFKSPPSFSDPTLRALFRQLSAWQSECSGFQLSFFTNVDEPREVCLVTGWTSIAAHEAWIRGERNQELLHVFAPYVDIQKVRMVHVGVDFEAMPMDVGGPDDAMVVERYDGKCFEETSFERERSEGYVWELVGRDLAQEDGDVFRFVGVAESAEGEVGGGALAPVQRWGLKRVEP